MSNSCATSWPIRRFATPSFIAIGRGEGRSLLSNSALPTIMPNTVETLSEGGGGDQIIDDNSTTSFTGHQPQHLNLGGGNNSNGECIESTGPKVSLSASESGMSSNRKRCSTTPLTSSTLTANKDRVESLPSSAGVSPSLSKQPSSPLNKKRRVSFCKTTKLSASSSKSATSQCPFLNTIKKIAINTNDNIMKQSVSCTALPHLADSSSSSSSSSLSTQASTGELDLTVSPTSFVETILLQSRGGLRGEDIISHATDRVKQDSYFVKYTDEHLEAYTNAMSQAVHANDVTTLRTLMQSGHVMQASNRFGESLLHTSCRRGYTSTVQFFVHEAKISPRLRDDMGRTPMHDACWSSSVPNHDIMKMLIEAAPEMLLSRDKRGHSPFDYARREYWPNWVTFLNDHRQFIVDSLVTSCLEGRREDELIDSEEDRCIGGKWDECGP